MTFDDGILTVYEVKNKAEPGDKPVRALMEKSRHYYGLETLGLSRYYTALAAQQQLETVLHIPEWPDVQTDDICRLETKRLYQIRMVQRELDENGLQITRLSLERWKEYDTDAGDAAAGEERPAEGDGQRRTL